MALSTTSRQTWHTGDDATTVYAYAYYIAVKTELEVVTRVIATGVEATLVVDTDYTVSGVGTAAGGNVTLTTALASTKVMTIRGKLPLTQTTDIRNQGTYYPYLHENAFDRAAQRDQQLQHEINRCIKWPVSYDVADIDAELPVPVASTAIGFNADGTALTTISSLSGIAASAFWLTMLDDASGDATLGTLSAALTTETAPAVGDLFFYYDASSSAGRQITLANLFKVIDALTEDTNPASGDEFATYDASASGAKKVKVSTLVVSDQTVLAQRIFS